MKRARKRDHVEEQRTQSEWKMWMAVENVGPRLNIPWRDPTARPGEIIGSVINILRGN